MKFLTFKKSLATAGLILASALPVFALSINSASAIQIPYSEIGDHDIKTPVFNTYTEVPNGVGNEADFVRVRPSTGDVADNGEGGVRNALYVNGHVAECNVGDQFDVRTYIHNGADDDYNDNGNGSSVAHETVVRMGAPLGVDGTDSTYGQRFTFRSSISAKDVSPVADTAQLYCSGDEKVQLKLVAQSVKVYSSHYGYNTVSDGAVNGDLTIGSRAVGSGDVWGCWADRVAVAYIVEVVEVEEPEVPFYACDLLTETLVSDKKYKFVAKATARNGAEIEKYLFNFGDGSSVVATENDNVEYTYSKDGSYNATVTVEFNVNGETKQATSDDCTTKITIDKEVENCPVPGLTHLPKDSDKCKTPETPKELPNTGAGSFVGIALATTMFGAFAHRFALLRK